MRVPPGTPLTVKRRFQKPEGGLANGFDSRWRYHRGPYFMGFFVDQGGFWVNSGLHVSSLLLRLATSGPIGITLPAPARPL